jgi:hypothetical protein
MKDSYYKMKMKRMRMRRRKGMRKDLIVMIVMIIKRLRDRNMVNQKSLLSKDFAVSLKTLNFLKSFGDKLLIWLRFVKIVIISI